MVGISSATVAYCTSKIAFARTIMVLILLTLLPDNRDTK